MFLVLSSCCGGGAGLSFVFVFVCLYIYVYIHIKNEKESVMSTHKGPCIPRILVCWYRFTETDIANNVCCQHCLSHRQRDANILYMAQCLFLTLARGSVQPRVSLAWKEFGPTPCNRHTRPQHPATVTPAPNTLQLSHPSPTPCNRHTRPEHTATVTPVPNTLQPSHPS